MNAATPPGSRGRFALCAVTPNPLLRVAATATSTLRRRRKRRWRSPVRVVRRLPCHVRWTVAAHVCPCARSARVMHLAFTAMQTQCKSTHPVVCCVSSIHLRLASLLGFLCICCVCLPLCRCVSCAGVCIAALPVAAISRNRPHGQSTSDVDALLAASESSLAQSSSLRVTGNDVSNA